VQRGRDVRRIAGHFFPLAGRLRLQPAVFVRAGLSVWASDGRQQETSMGEREAGDRNGVKKP
jgi:hypothetical protein